MIGMILSGSIIITSIPIAGVAAQNTDSKPTADELLPAGYMKPEDFDRDAVNAYADSIVAGTSSISDIGRLPQYSEFVAQTGYSHSVLSLTVFRETYGTGTDFQAPVNAVICIKNESELDLLSSLVNHNEANETAEEQAYYANASYTLQGDILYTSRRFLPIGTVTTPFNGSFDGDGFEITGLQINGDSQSTYTGVEYFGLFGYIGAEGQVSNLGLTNTTINLPYTLGADVGVLAGRNYGTISDCYVNGTENWYDDDYNEYDMNTTRVTVSNGTVGGIAAENYGTIERVYADFVPNVSITSGTYSEPQPIASINRGTITDSYYFGEEINGYFGTAMKAENKGLGTAATRAAIINSLFSNERAYLTKDGKSILPTEKGMFLIEHLPVEDLKSPEMTGQWEKRLHDIAAGKEDYYSFVSDMNETIRRWYTIIATYTGETYTSKENTQQLPCPFCGAKVIKKNSYFCSAKKATGCPFSVSQAICGKKITDAQVLRLIEKGKTTLIRGFKKKNGAGTFDAYLVADKAERRIRFEFPKK